MKLINIQLIGNIVEVTYEIGDDTKVIRRNVQGFASLTKKEKAAVIAEIIGQPTVVFKQKRSLLDRILRRH